MTQAEVNRFHQHWVGITVLGILLTACGIFDLIVPGVSSLAVEFWIGCMLICAAVFNLILASQLWRHRPFVWKILSSVILALTGIFLIRMPFAGLLSLTVLLCGMFIIEGIIDLGIAFSGLPAGGWIFLLSGVLNLLAAALILVGLPVTAGIALGIITGVNLIFFGAALIALGISTHHLWTHPMGHFAPG